jgi:tetratricopeptide (TPR) repeat protein
VSVDSQAVLAGFQQAANGPPQLLNAIDQLTRKLRRRIGESLREVESSPPLDQVTTSSLDALRKYAEGLRLPDRGPLASAERMREAIHLDTNFAMAYAALAVDLNNGGFPRNRVDSALERAHRLRDRLTERERLQLEAMYFQLGPGHDRRRAAEAYEAILALDPAAVGAANNLANIYTGRRQYARAESLLKGGVAGGRGTSTLYGNLNAVLFSQGKLDEAKRYEAEWRERFPTAPMVVFSRIRLLYEARQFDSLEALLQQMARDDNVVLRINGLAGLMNEALLRGRLRDASRHYAEQRRVQLSIGDSNDPVADSLRLSTLDVLFYADTARALRRLDSVLGQADLSRRPFDERPYFELAGLYASAGRPQRARGLLALHDAEVPDSLTRRDREPGRHGVLGAILLAEGRHSDAIREIWRSDSTYDGPDGSCAICVLDDIGWAWDRAGVADSAIYYWEKFLTTRHPLRTTVDAMSRPAIQKRLGELYESKGDVAKAAVQYREFIELWAKADRALQPIVDDARWRLSRLADIERR